MTSENFLACVSMCFENLLQALHRSDAVFNFIQKYLERLKGNKEESRVEGHVCDVSTLSPSSSYDESTNTVSFSRELPKLSLDEQDLILALNKSCKTSCCELAQRSLTQLLSLRKDANAKVNSFFTFVCIHTCMYTNIYFMFIYIFASQCRLL